METIGERLRHLRGDMKQLDVAAIVGTTKQYVSQLELGRNKTPNGAFLEGWARYFGVSLQWLATGKGAKFAPPPADETEWGDIQGYSQQAGLSDGVEADEYAQTHKLKFRQDSLAKQRLKPKDLAVFYGKGDSMEPRIRDGDAILFDTSDTRPRDDKLFVVMVPGAAAKAYSIKRCEIINDMVFFRADNPNGDHRWKKPRLMDDKKNPIEIIGRVRWIGSWEG